MKMLKFLTFTWQKQRLRFHITNSKLIWARRLVGTFVLLGLCCRHGHLERGIPGVFLPCFAWGSNRRAYFMKHLTGSQTNQLKTVTRMTRIKNQAGTTSIMHKHRFGLFLFVQNHEQSVLRSRRLLSLALALLLKAVPTRTSLNTFSKGRSSRSTIRQLVTLKPVFADS